jgi:hypothetical protein
MSSFTGPIARPETDARIACGCPLGAGRSSGGGEPDDKGDDADCEQMTRAHSHAGGRPGWRLKDAGRLSLP